MSHPKLSFNAQGTIDTWRPALKCGIILGSDNSPVYIGPSTAIAPALVMTVGNNLTYDFTEVDGIRYATSVRVTEKKKCDCDCECKKKATPPPSQYGKHVGRVRWFNPIKGYGFLDDDSRPDKPVFVHISAVERAGLSALNEGQRVEFEVVSNRGKESAENLRIL